MKITIVTSTLNCRNDIILTSKSIGSQTYSNIEWIVIDGGSTDGTIDLLSSDDKVTYWVSEKDDGIYSALNKGICQSNGDWIIFMGAGDIFYSNETLEQVARKLSAIPGLYLVAYGDVLFIRDNKVIHHYGEIDFSKWHSIRPALPSHQGVFHSKILFKSIGVFDASYQIASDSKILLKAKEISAFFYLNLKISYMPSGGVSSNIKYYLLRNRELKRLAYEMGYRIPIFRLLKSYALYVVLFLIDKFSPKNAKI